MKLQDFRARAAETEADRLRGLGYDVVVVERPDHDSPSPRKNGIPAIFEVSELERYKAELAAAPAQGVALDRVPPPTPLLDFSAWRFYPTCPNCSGRRLNVEGIGEVNGRDFDVVTVILGLKHADVSCLRPKQYDPGDKRDCGWSGEARELSWPCFGCGLRKPGAARGTCPECAAPPPTTAAVAEEATPQSIGDFEFPTAVQEGPIPIVGDPEPVRAPNVTCSDPADQHPDRRRKRRRRH